MIVDDSIMNQLYLSTVAKSMGCNVFIAQNGKEAVEESMCSKYDLIFMDLEMPILKGDEATYIIRKGNLNSSTPIILQSSGIINNVIFHKTEGFTEEISKPYVQSEVKDIISKYSSENI
jgi:CheY-like chemotaxis protein